MQCRNGVSRTKTEAFPDPSEPYNYALGAWECPNCDGVSFTLEKNPSTPKATLEIIYPVDHGFEPPPADVPEKYRSDFNEACAVLPISPQCSAALARRMLQALLLDPAAGKVVDQGKGDNLAKQIDRAMSGIPNYVGDHLHTLREMGNFAAHEQLDKSTGLVLPVEEHEARFALEVIEEMFELYFIGPARAAAKKAAWNAGKQVPAGKKPVS